VLAGILGAGLLAPISPAFAADPITTFRASLEGAQSGYRGYDVFVRVLGEWRRGEPATINTTTDEVTVASRTYTGAEQFAFFPADGGTLPSAVHKNISYKACDISGNTFKINSTSISGCVGNFKDFTDVGTGQQYVSLPTTGPTWYVRDLVLPTGVTLKGVYRGGNLATPDSLGRYVGSGALEILLHVEPTAPLTEQTIQATAISSGSPDRILTMPFHAKQLTPLTLTPATYFPAINGQPTWQSVMLSKGDELCPINPSTGKRDPGTQAITSESQVWYYDGAWVYRQIADWTGDPSWDDCADSISAQYNAQVSGTGAPQAWRVFTDGLRSSGYIATVKKMADNGLFSNTGGGSFDYYVRETTFILETAINAAESHGYDSPAAIPTTDPSWVRIKRNIEWTTTKLLGWLDGYRNDNYTYQQSFMTGLALNALRRYWEFSGDPRIPVETAAAMNHIWDVMWVPAVPAETLINNPAPLGARCEWGCAPEGGTMLINLVAANFAWLYSITNQNGFFWKGNDMFRRSFAATPWSGKEFSQNFRFSFDFVKYRLGQPPYRP